MIKLAIFVLLLNLPIVVAQPNSINREYDEASNRPTLAIPIEQVAKLKIAMRRPVVHRGEMIALDVALLTTSSSSIFIPQLETAALRVFNSQGRQIAVNYFFIVDRRFTPSLVTSTLFEHTILLIVGCSANDLSFPFGIDNYESDKLWFDKALFISKGDACVDVRREGRYSFLVELVNNKVVTFDGDVGSKTAVGSLNSNRLTLSIRK